MTTSCLAVINQMDTSQAHLSSKAGLQKDSAKPNDLSKDELHAVLKYGAQRMCVLCPSFVLRGAVAACRC